ncbi:MAG: nucleoside-diphosphate kinase, partial [Mariniphaga sp.]|nr:nucleoside-diphosphate kinase [Mariniphaga sp.]
MAGNLTFTMIKPDAVEKNAIGPILKIMNEAGFVIKAMKYTFLTPGLASSFYSVHKGKPFYEALVK